MFQYAEVILPFPLHNTFTYRIGFSFTQSAEIGKRVLVQFGKTKIFTGIIIELHNRTPEKYKVKEIIDILDDHAIIYPVQIMFWRWLADYYCCSLGEVMAVALPSSMKIESESSIILNDEFHGEVGELNDNEMKVIEALDHKKILSIPIIQQLTELKNVLPIIKSLYQQGIILTTEKISESYKPRMEQIIELHPDYHNEINFQEVFRQLERSPKQLDVLLAFNIISKKNTIVLLKELAEKASVNIQIIKTLVKKGILVLKNINVERVTFDSFQKENFDLTLPQSIAYKKVCQLFEDKECVLLHGVTNSGKTHIYMKLIEKTIQQGRQVLYLVPEIALTTQLIKKLQSYFGDKIGIYHSRYNPNERYEIWHKTLSGGYDVVLGVRSALFLPFKNLGLIVIDEEHESTFKQQNPAPRYQARDSAIMLAAFSSAKALLGSATPSFESLNNSILNKYGYVELTDRFLDVRPPEIILADVKDNQIKKKMKGHLTSTLYKEIEECLNHNEQTILFLNRRGYAPYIECKTCGWIPQCKHCDISLTYHKSTRQMNCHYCGYKTDTPSVCPICGNASLIMKGFGTEKIEDDIELLYPEARFLRLDLDTTKSKESFKKIIGAFEKGDADILIGTQMVTKGLDFEKVKLVGILNADQMINYPDFRAAERSYQLMAQVSGRAGRRSERGKVIIQTYKVNQQIFQFLMENNYRAFYESEIKSRFDFHYPPFTKLIKITLKSFSTDLLEKGSNHFALRLKSHFGNRVLGPEFPIITKIQNEYQKEILIKFEKNQKMIFAAKKLILEEISKFIFEPEFKKIRCILNIDP